jgi:transposase-like protein DUF772
LAVLVYAYCVGERSSRRIECRIHEDVAFRVVGRNLHPGHATFARFRAMSGVGPDCPVVVMLWPFNRLAEALEWRAVKLIALCFFGLADVNPFAYPNHVVKMGSGRGEELNVRT